MTKSQTEIWGDYVRLIAGDVTQAEIAQRADVHQTTVGTWLNHTQLPRPANVTLLAKSFGCGEVEAMIAAGLLTDRGKVWSIVDDAGLKRLADVGVRGARAQLKRRQARNDQSG